MLSKKDVLDLATLARISIDENEAESIAPKLDSILGYVSEVSEVVTEDMPARPGMVKNVLRDDIPKEGGEFTQAILDNTPSREGDFVKVKQIF